MRTNSRNYTLAYICGYWLVKLIIRLVILILRTIVRMVAYLFGHREPKKRPIGFHAGEQT